MRLRKSQDGGIYATDPGIIAEKSNPDDIKALIERTIPRCNLCFVQGRELESALSRLYNVLYEISPSAVGGNVPDSGIFFK